MQTGILIITPHLSPLALLTPSLPSLSLSLSFSLFDQAGFFVGITYQVFGSPSPYFQISKFRWLVGGLTMSVYVSVLLMPGTLGYLLAFMFEQVIVGSETFVAMKGRLRRAA